MSFKHKLNEALNRAPIEEAIKRRIPQELQIPDGLDPADEKEWKKKQRAHFKEEDKAAKEIAKRIATRIPPGGNAQDLALALGLIPKAAGTKAIRRPDLERGQPIALTDIPWEEVSAFAENFPTYIADYPEISDDKVIITVKNNLIDLAGKRTKKGDTEIPAQMASVLNMLRKGVEQYGAVNFVRRVLKSYGAKWQEFQRATRDVSKKRPEAPITVFSIDVNDTPIEMEDKDASMESPKREKVSAPSKGDAEADQILADIMGDIDMSDISSIDVSDVPEPEPEQKSKKPKKQKEKDPAISPDEQDFMDDLLGT